MPKRKYSCETCGANDLSRNQYYRGHHNEACLAAAVAALRQHQAPAAEGAPEDEHAIEAHEGGEQGGIQVPGSGTILRQQMSLQQVLQPSWSRSLQMRITLRQMTSTSST